MDRSQDALDVGDVERASEHTVEAEALDREPRVHLKREQYQRALRDPDSLPGQLLQRSYDMMGRAQERAETLMRDFKDMLNQSIDRLDDLLASLRGEERPAFAVGSTSGRDRDEQDQVTRDTPVSDHAERGPADDLDAALNALRAEPDADASAERARQALTEEEQRRADLAQAREIEVATEQERVRVLEVEREAEALRLKEEQARHVARNRGPSHGL